MSKFVRRLTDKISGGSDSEKKKGKKENSTRSNTRHEASSSSQKNLWRKASKHHLGPFSDSPIAKVTKEINDHRAGEGHLIWYEQDGSHINVIISKTQPKAGHDYQLDDGGVSLGKQTFNADDPDNEKLWDALAAMVKPEDESEDYTRGW